MKFWSKVVLGFIGRGLVVEKQDVDKQQTQKTDKI